jgi:alkane 1-monooxygenase
MPLQGAVDAAQGLSCGVGRAVSRPRLKAVHMLSQFRFALAWMLPVLVMAGALISPWGAWLAGLGYQLLLAALERVPALQHSPAAVPQTAWHRACVRVHVPLQALLLTVGVWVAAHVDATTAWAVPAVIALGFGVGSVTGGQGITFAHELGHSKSRLDRVLGWLLMGSVGYAHFMVEHYRGHHPRAATFDDPASARRGESLWRFLPRTLSGSLFSAWALEAQRLRQFKRSWSQSPLLWASLMQVVFVLAIAAVFGALAGLFWLVQAAYAVFLLEAINYIEHYGLQRKVVAGKREPFAMQHAWNADHVLTNSMIANLQRHSDHHMHAWKPYAELQALPGPQLPTGYAGCLFLACMPRLWFGVMHKRLDALGAA